MLREIWRSFRLVFLVFAALSLVATACGDDDDDGVAVGEGGGDGSEETSGETSEDDVRTYTVGYSSTPGIGDLGTFLTWEALRDKGIKVETKFFSDQDVVIQALESGEIDFATNLAASATLQAADAGLPMKIFTGYVGPEFVLAGETEITEAADLEGKTVAVHSEGGQTMSFMQALIEKYDLQDVTILVIPNSSARAQALLQGQLDAAPVDLGDAILVESEDAENYHTILFFGEEFPVANSGTTATEAWLDENAEDAQLIVTTLLETYQRMNDEPEWAAERAPQYLGSVYELDLLEQIVNEYLDRDLWPPDGGLDREVAEETIEFNKQYSGLEAENDDLEAYYDFTFIEAALEEVGES